MRRNLASFVVGVFIALSLSTGALAQCNGNPGSGRICGNAGSSPGIPGWYTASALLDANFGAPSPQGTILNRGASFWGATAAPILGIPGTSTGQIGLAGATSGTAILKAQSSAGSAISLLPTSAGTLVSTASSPLAIDPATGQASCPTCVTSSGGGAISGTAPIAVSAAGVVSINAPYQSLTASNGGIVWSDATNLNILAGTATARQMLQSGASATPAWSTATWPATTTINQILYSSSANAVAGLATANGAILNTSSGGIPALTATPVLGVAGSTIGSIGFQNATSGVVTVQPVTGALGTVTASLPANTGVIAETNYVQTWTALQTFNSGDLTATSPSFLGVPTAPTAALGTNTTQLATTAFTQAAISGECTAAGGFLVGTGSSSQCSTAAASVATLNGGPLAINPTANSANLGLFIQQTGVGSSPSPCYVGGPLLGYAYNCIHIIDGISPGPNYGLYVEMDSTLAGATGGGGAFFGNTVGGSASSSVAGAAGVTSYSNVTSNYAGGTTLSPAGASYGFSTYGRAIGTNMHLSNVTGGEINWEATGAGTDVNYMSGLQIVANDNQTIHGTTYDAVLSLSKKGSAVGANQGILFSNANGGHPVATTGTLLQTMGSTTVTNGIDISSYTYSGNAWKSPGFRIGPDGSFSFDGSSSGTGTLSAQAAAGTPALLWPTGSGTLASSATSPLSLNATTGALSCPTCNTSSATVSSITPGNGLTSTLTATAPGSAITGAGTVSAAQLVNAQSGTSYAIVDGDRAKLITATNAAAQAYSIAQAGAASAFQAGWFVDINNNSTNVAGIITVTPATSTINGAATLKIQLGQSVRIVSDGTNYQIRGLGNGSQLPGTTTNDNANAGNVGEFLTANCNNVAIISGADTNCTSVSLTAGDWDVSNVCYYVPAATTTVTSILCGLNTVSGTVSLGLGLYARQYISNNTAVPNTPISVVVPATRVSLSATTTYYLNGNTVFGTSTMAIYGIINARRVR